MEDLVRDCVCLIHGRRYSWEYVTKLHSMLNRNSTVPIRLHVLTEPDRVVPAPMIKHDLQLWPGIAGPRLAWWYKMQMFDQARFSGFMVYFDLDVVITNNIDWLWQQDPKCFWAIHDFRRLWRVGEHKINSSVMAWDTKRFYWIWEDFSNSDMQVIIKKYRGDQNYLDAVMPGTHLRFFEQTSIKSWKWQISKNPGILPLLKSQIKNNTDLPCSIIIFHGDPKPHEITEPHIQQHWK